MGDVLTVQIKNVSSIHFITMALKQNNAKFNYKVDGTFWYIRIYLGGWLRNERDQRKALPGVQCIQKWTYMARYVTI